MSRARSAPVTTTAQAPSVSVGADLADRQPGGGEQPLDLLPGGGFRVAELFQDLACSAHRPVSFQGTGTRAITTPSRSSGPAAATSSWPVRQTARRLSRVGPSGNRVTTTRRAVS